MDKPSLDVLARRFNEVAHELGLALAAQLQEQDPVFAKAVMFAVQNGHKMMVGLEFDPVDAAIRWITIDGYQKVSQVMSITAPAQKTGRH